MTIEYWLHIEKYASNENIVHIKKYIEEKCDILDMKLDFFIDNSDVYTHDMLLSEEEHKTLILECNILEEHCLTKGIDNLVELFKALDTFIPKEHNFLLEDAEGNFLVKHRSELEKAFKLQKMNRAGLF